MPITIWDIAKHLNVSVSTVSRALNDYDDVAPKTRQRVFDAASELGYYPSDAARSLRLQRTDRVGLLVPSTINYMGEYFSELILGVTLASAELGSNLMLYATTTDELEQLTRICRAREVDGVILIGSAQLEEAIPFLKKEALPFVVLGRPVDDPDVSFIDSDNTRGALIAMRHLIELNHVRIAYIGRSEQPAINTKRIAGYRQALEEASLSCDDELLVSAHLGSHTGYQAMNKLLDLPAPPTAVCAFNDQIAMNALQAALERGLSVPQDVAIIGYNDIRSSLSTTPRLTTIRQPLPEMGKKAVEALMTLVAERNKGPVQLTLPIKLVVRGSTDPER